MVQNEGHSSAGDARIDGAPRTEVIGDCTLILGDCRELVARGMIGHCDACITDPPYGINNKAQSGFDTRTLKGLKVNRHRWEKIVGDDGPFDPSWLFPPTSTTPYDQKR